MTKTAAGRHKLDWDYVIPALLSGQTNEQIALRESVRLGETVTRNVIVGVRRDLKAGKLKVSALRDQQADEWVDTYLYGVEPDNGGLADYTGHMTLDGDYVITNDWHSPFIDRKFAESVVDWARYFGISRMIVAGDILDGNSQNNFRTKVRHVPLQRELKIARLLFSHYADSGFEDIVALPGNHDDWFLQNHSGELEINDMMRLLWTPEIDGVLEVTPYDRVKLISGGEPWTIPHQANYAVFPLKVGNELSAQFRTNMIIPHQHHSADGWSRYGEPGSGIRHYRIIDSGGLFDPAKLSYINLKTTTKATPAQGFVVVKDGYAQLITPDRRQTRWELIKDVTWKSSA